MERPAPEGEDVPALRTVRARPARCARGGGARWHAAALAAVLAASPLPGWPQDDAWLDELLGPAEGTEETQPSEASEGTQQNPQQGRQDGSGEGAQDASSPERSQAPEKAQPRPRDPASVPTIPVGREPEPPLERAPPPRRQIEEIVVTAQKTEQSLQDVPISITALEGDFLKEVGANNMQDVAAYIPNLQFSSDTDPALAQVNVRGFGSNPFNAAFESSVAFSQDELFFARPGYISEALFDVARIEVLRGPQGTLFGKNTVAGVFNVTTKNPTPEFSADLRASYADPREYRVEGGAGGMLTDWFGARGSFLNFERDGELNNTSAGGNNDAFEQQAQRLKLLFRPTQELELLVNAVHSDTESAYWPLQLSELDEDTEAFLREFDPEVEGDPHNQQLSHNIDGFLDKGSRTLSLQADWAIGGLAGLDALDATLVVGWSDLFIDSLVDLDTSPADLAGLTVVSDHVQRSAELRFAGRDADGLFGLGDGLEFVVGAFAFDSTFSQDTSIAAGEDLARFLLTDDALQLLSGQPIGTGGLLTTVGGIDLVGELVGGIGSALIGDDRVDLDYVLDTRSTAVFGQATWHLGGGWSITPGLRFTRERKEAIAAAEAVCPGSEALPRPCVMQAALQAQNFRAEDLERTETNVSPKVSLQYFFGDDDSVFATWARGFKSGGFNASSFTGDDLEFDEEEAESFELGLKSLLFNRSLQVNLTLFRTTLDNLQVLAFNGAFFDVTNAAAATSQGLELDFQWLSPWEFFSLSGSLGLLDATFDRFPNAPAPVGSGEESQDLAGKTLPLAPEKSASLTPTVTLPLPFGLGVQLAVDFLYQGSQFTDTDLDPATFVPAHLLLSARASIGPPSQRWSLTLGGSNITDKQLSTQISDTVFFPGSFNNIQKPSRKLFAALRVDW